MSTEVSIFKADLPTAQRSTGLSTLAASLTASEYTSRRISIKGGFFRKVVNGEEVAKLKDREMNVIIINALPKVSRQFYAAAADNPREDIRNPIHYPEELIAHIPDEARVRSYGCGSPVIDANPQPGDVVVDLGSGTGVECFIAARLVGGPVQAWFGAAGPAFLAFAGLLTMFLFARALHRRAIFLRL